MGSESSKIVGATSWPHIFTPILAAVAVRFIAPGAGRPQILYLGLILFVLNYLLALITGGWARQKKCGEFDVRVALAPALIHAFGALLIPLGSYIVLKITEKIPAAGKALQVVDVGIKILGGNPVFLQVPVTTIATYVGALIGTAVIVGQKC